MTNAKDKRRKFRDDFKKLLTDKTDNFPIWDARIAYWESKLPDGLTPEPEHSDRTRVIRELIDEQNKLEIWYANYTGVEA